MPRPASARGSAEAKQWADTTAERSLAERVRQLELANRQLKRTVEEQQSEVNELRGQLRMAQARAIARANATEHPEKPVPHRGRPRRPSPSTMPIAFGTRVEQPQQEVAQGVHEPAPCDGCADRDRRLGMAEQRLVAMAAELSKERRGREEALAALATKEAKLDIARAEHARLSTSYEQRKSAARESSNLRAGPADPCL